LKKYSNIKGYTLKNLHSSKRMNIAYQIALVFVVTTCGCVVHSSPAWPTSMGESRYAQPQSVEDLYDPFPVGYDETMRLGNYQRKRSNPETEKFSRMSRRQELTNLYGKIVKEFPFLANQGLNNQNHRKLSIDDLLSMSVFGQPKMGRKWWESTQPIKRIFYISSCMHSKSQFDNYHTSL